MSVKLLVSGLSGAGKTSLTKCLKDTMVIYHDGKKYPYSIPHVTVNDFEDVNQFTDLVSEKIEAYKEKMGSYPRSIVFDSVSKIFDTISDNCNRKYNNYDIYTNLNREINLFTSFIEDSLVASGMNVILISHALYDSDNARYSLVAGGAFAKRGGFYAEVDEAIFVEAKSNKRLIHFRSTKFPARTLYDENEDLTDVKDFNLQEYVETLEDIQQNVDNYEL
jgi:hypothetical protein